MLPKRNGRIWNPPLQILFLSVGVGALDNPKYCRGGYHPPVIYKKSLRFARDAGDDVPYRVWWFL